MELQKGICSLCSENKVFIPSDAEQFRTCLLEIIREKYVNDEDTIRDQITLCPLCCFKLQKASDIQKAIKETEGKESNEKHCRFCHDGNHPQLRKNIEKESETPKRKSMLKSPALSRKRKMYDNCFTYLQPLSSSKEYQVADHLKKDRKLFHQIPNVNLQDSQDVDIKETPKTRPVIKIKLKKPQGGVDEFVAEPYIKLVKSDEQPGKKAENKVRHSSYTSQERYEIVNEPSEKISGTPKTGSLSQLAPKRRVSVYLDGLEFADEKSSNAELDPNKADTVTDITSLEISPSIDSQQALNVVERINESNGLENGSCVINLNSEDVNNEATLKENQEEVIDLGSTSDSPLSSRDASPQNTDFEIQIDSSDSDDKLTDKSLIGSERKKKRVTFSDEIN